MGEISPQEPRNQGMAEKQDTYIPSSEVTEPVEIVHQNDPTVGDIGLGVRLDPYGIPLHPLPTTDPLDPLNWSQATKYLILFITCYSSFLCVFLTGTPIASFYLLEEQFNASYSQVNWTLAIPSLGLAIGPLLFSSLADTWGRRTILIGTCALTMLATGCTGIESLSYGAYMFFRFLQGVGAGPCTVIGFGIIRDISWEYERGFNVGLWVLAVDIGGVGGCLGEPGCPFTIAKMALWLTLWS